MSVFIAISTICAILLSSSFVLQINQGAWAGTFPGENGQIAFARGSNRFTEIYVMNADGTGQTRLTTSVHDPSFIHSGDIHPSWSPDGTKIAFASYRDATTTSYNPEIYVMNADGSNQSRLTNNEGFDVSPDWGKSPAGAPTTPGEVIDELISTIQNLDNVPQGVKTSLIALLEEVSNILNDNNPNNDESVCGTLDALIDQLNLNERRDTLTADQADNLRTQAEDIGNELLVC